MIKSAQESPKNQPVSAPQTPQSQTITIDAVKLNSVRLEKGRKSLLNYSRWVLDTKENRAALKAYLLHRILFTKEYNRQMKYLKCCNVFYSRTKLKAISHQEHIKAHDLLLTEDESAQIRDFINESRKKTQSVPFRIFRLNLIPELISFARGLKLTKIDSFINSLPRNEGCFEFPISRNRLTFNCLAKDLDKKNRVLKVDQKHNLVFTPEKINTKIEKPSPCGSKEGELSPTAKKIIELNGSSNKKLKVGPMAERPMKPILFTRSGRKVKRTHVISDPFFRMEDSAHGKIFKGWSEEVTSTSGVCFTEGKENSKIQKAKKSVQVDDEEEKEDFDDLAFLMSKMSFFSRVPGLIKTARPQKTQKAESSTALQPSNRTAALKGYFMDDSSEASSQTKADDSNEYPLKLARELQAKAKEMIRISRELKKALIKKGEEKNPKDQ